MADPVKTSALRAIRDAIETALGPGQVVRNPAREIDRDAAPFPLAFVFDEPESIEWRNRIALVTMPLHIEVWIQDREAMTISDQADSIQAVIYQALMTDTDVRYWTMRIEPARDNSAAKFYVDEHLGGVILRYLVQYAYKWGDPYNTAK